jgi:hypothetical protein
MTIACMTNPYLSVSLHYLAQYIFDIYLALALSSALFLSNNYLSAFVVFTSKTAPTTLRCPRCSRLSSPCKPRVCHGIRSLRYGGVTQSLFGFYNFFELPSHCVLCAFAISCHSNHIALSPFGSLPSVFDSWRSHCALFSLRSTYVLLSRQAVLLERSVGHVSQEAFTRLLLTRVAPEAHFRCIPFSA